MIIKLLVQFCANLQNKTIIQFQSSKLKKLNNKIILGFYVS